ncbi:permease-like cell division protein FtsX [Clostridiaceae bacterium M8S5]|nr:permease-like cell division protein FtsX [Clostridiaceae bacterium M8S5]
MGIRSLGRSIKEGFKGVFRNRLMSIASVCSVTSVLIILGIIMIVILNINNCTLTVKDSFDEMQVYIKNDVIGEPLKNMKSQIEAIKGVKKVEFLSKEKAFELEKERYGDDAFLLEGFKDENPLPNKYIIYLIDISYADSVVKELKKLEGTDIVKYYKDIIDKMLYISKMVRMGGLVIIGILMAISIFIITNTIRITVAARKREINIMKYVGATNGFIRGPFVMEGIILGLIASGISILIVNFTYNYVFKIANEKLYIFMTMYIIPPFKIFNDIVILFTAIGVGIGILGSIISLRKFLKV